MINTYLAAHVWSTPNSCTGRKTQLLPAFEIENLPTAGFAKQVLCKLLPEGLAALG
jgi:hypothetical protein